MKTPTYHRFSFVNSFNSSQLKLRIKMMNQPQKRWAFVKYPLALLIAASLTMAFVSKERIAKNLGEIAPTKTTWTAPIAPKPSTKNPQQPIIKQISRYMIQKNDKLCFVITPKMNLGTLGDIQKMIEKYTDEKLIIHSVSFDHQNIFIKAIDYEFSKQKGRTTMYGDTHKEESISSNSFAIDLKTNKNSLQKSKNPPSYFLTDTIPEFSKVIVEDEKMVKSFIEKNKVLYDMAAAESLILSKLNKNHTVLGFNNVQRLVEKHRKITSESDLFIQRGDFLSILDIEKHKDRAVYMLNDKILTDDDLSKINMNTIENVKIYANQIPIPENTQSEDLVFYVLLIPKQ